MATAAHVCADPREARANHSGQARKKREAGAPEAATKLHERTQAVLARRREGGEQGSKPAFVACACMVARAQGGMGLHSGFHLQAPRSSDRRAGLAKAQ